MNNPEPITEHDASYWLSCLGKIFFAIIIGWYFWQAILNPKTWHLIDGANLAIHETGHLFTRFAIPVIQMLAGTLAQLFIPSVLIIYFLIANKNFSAFIIMLWLSQSLANISVYIADAIDMQLPLIGGPGTIHDWNWLLTRWGILDKTDIISQTVWWTGVIIACLASIGILIVVWQDDRDYF